MLLKDAFPSKGSSAGGRSDVTECAANGPPPVTLPDDDSDLWGFCPDIAVGNRPVPVPPALYPSLSARDLCRMAAGSVDSPMLRSVEEARATNCSRIVFSSSAPVDDSG